jgi:hypothetical protein
MQKGTRQMGVTLGLGVITKRKNANWISHILHRNYLLKHVIQQKIGSENEEEDVSCPWMTLGKREETGICEGKHYNALSGELGFGTGYGPVTRQTTK